MKLNKKRGNVVDLQFMPLFTLVFAAIVIMFLFAYAKSWDDSTYLLRNYYAKDIGLGIDTLLLSPGEVSLEYHKSIEGMQIEVKEGVSIKSLDFTQGVKTAEYPYVTIKDYQIRTILYPIKEKTKINKTKFILKFDKTSNRLDIEAEDVK